MWLLTPFGFFSIVQKPDDADRGTLTIRGRAKSDLEDLRKRYLPAMSEIIENAGTDYRYRANASRSDVQAAVGRIVQDLDYGNFKDEVARRQGSRRAKIYGKVWDALYELQQ